MSSREIQPKMEGQPLDGIDELIRWVLVDEVAGEEPSPQVWDHIQQRIKTDTGTAGFGGPTWHKALSRYLLIVYLTLRGPRDLENGYGQQVAVSHSLAAQTSLVSGWDFRFC